ncbi:hypothetical protein ACGTNG_12640 [Halomonas sp. 1390]|uniref:hypothetical protein n=1 Tax=Halomonas sp. B23F22_3 TaxID=3459516 RepID=UPI00373E8FBE
MIFDAYRTTGNSVMAGAAEKAKLGADVQLSQRQSNDWRIVHGLEAGAVISQVEALPAHLQALARYCFGPFTRDELAADAEVVQIALYRKLLADGVKLPGQGRGKPTAEQLETLRYLSAAALYHHSETTWPYRRQGLPTPVAVKAWMAGELGVKIETRFWRRADRATWGVVWDQGLSILDSWERQCLSTISSAVPQAA